MTSLLCIGECMVEMAATAGQNFRLGFAGDTFNTAWHARKILGTAAQVNYFTALGDDDMSRRMLAFIADQNIGTDFIVERPNMRPGLYTIELNNGERSFTYWRDTSAARTLADDVGALENAIAQHDAIYFSGITLAILSADARRNFLTCLRAARQAGKLIAFDSNLRPKLWPSLGAMREAVNEAAAVTTLALPTMPDETDLFSDSNATDIARRYQAAGVAEVVIKAGAEPAQLFWQGKHEAVASFPVTPIDTTGAGDSFNGAYIACRIMGKSPQESAIAAHARAAAVLQCYGALDL